jgi:hypothetical protein
MGLECPCRLPTGAGAEAGIGAGARLGRLVVSVAESSRLAEWEAVGDLVRGWTQAREFLLGQVASTGRYCSREGARYQVD